MVTQEHVIDALHARFKDDPLVFALWLEGSDAFDRVDEYSDVDVVMDVEDGHEEATLSHVEDALRTLGDLDLVSPVGRPNQHLWHKVFHIKGSSEYLYIDVDIQRHSRDFSFIEGDPDERPRVIFDKAQVLRFKPAEANAKELAERLHRIKSFFAQRTRVTKYLRRGLFLEAWASYHRCVLQPLVELLRLRYRPAAPTTGSSTPPTTSRRQCGQKLKDCFR